MRYMNNPPDRPRAILVIRCKGKDMTHELTKAVIFYWHGIGEVWQFDEHDTEIIATN